MELEKEEGKPYDRAYCCGRKTIQNGRKLIWHITKLMVSILSAPYLAWYFFWPKSGINGLEGLSETVASIAVLVIGYHIICRIFRHRETVEFYATKGLMALKYATIAWLILSLPVALISFFWIWGPNSVTGITAWIVLLSFAGAAIDLIAIFLKTMFFLDEHWHQAEHFIVSKIGQLALLLRLC